VATQTRTPARTGGARSERRTQAERSATTRARLLDATVESLADVGYGGTTVAGVAARAGLSKGAHLHHFRTKTELVTAALDHIFQARQQQFVAASELLPEGPELGPAVVDLLWALFQGTSFSAWVELVVAARTDDELRPRVADLEHSFAASVLQTFVRLFVPPGASLTPEQAAAPALLFAVLEGLAFQRLVRGGPDFSEPVLASVKSLAHLFVPDR
jgi:AcrR family transcriptional regulator